MLPRGKQLFYPGVNTLLPVAGTTNCHGAVHVVAVKPSAAKKFTLALYCQLPAGLTAAELYEMTLYCQLLEWPVAVM